jgi:hypothetical protein
MRNFGRFKGLDERADSGRNPLEIRQEFLIRTLDHFHPEGVGQVHQKRYDALPTTNSQKETPHEAGLRSTPGCPRLRVYIMSMSGMPPPGIFSSFFGSSATITSVVSSRPETDEAFCNARRVTLVGSRIPISIRSPYSPVWAL